MGDTHSRHLVLLGTGTSVGVPMIGCHCDVCESDDPRNQRTRCGVAVEAPEGLFLIDTPGVRRSGRIEPTIERYSVLRTIRSIDQSDVVFIKSLIVWQTNMSFCFVVLFDFSNRNIFKSF